MTCRGLSVPLQWLQTTAGTKSLPQVTNPRPQRTNWPSAAPNITVIKFTFEP
jgi:hypothetical protein